MPLPGSAKPQLHEKNFTSLVPREAKASLMLSMTVSS
jgi:hypothetical protein